MRHSWIGLALVFTVFVGGACSNQRTYEVRGRVVGFGDDGRTLIVEHGEVPGLMGAMTMPFTVGDTTNLAAVGVRDAVSFTLVLARDSTWLRNLQLLPDSALPEHPAGSPDLSTGVSQAPPILEVGDPVPDAELTTHADTTLRLRDLEGQSVVLTFIYTRCPMPDFCPLMSQRFATLQPLLHERYGDAVRLLSVSIDPTYDTPEVLSRYADRYADDLSNWTFATADSAEVHRLARRLGTFYTTSGSEIIHNLSTVLIAPDGTVRKYFRGNDWQPEDVIDAIDGFNLDS